MAKKKSATKRILTLLIVLVVIAVAAIVAASSIGCHTTIAIQRRSLHCDSSASEALCMGSGLSGNCSGVSSQGMG